MRARAGDPRAPGGRVYGGGGEQGLSGWKTEEIHSALAEPPLDAGQESRTELIVMATPNVIAGHEEGWELTRRIRQQLDLHAEIQQLGAPA